jgi:menaquinone-dependent protoporphyrinogen oxidase
MQRIAIIYDSSEGQTEKIANRIVELASAEGASCDLYPVSSAPRELIAFDHVLVAGSVHLGKQSKSLKDYVTRNLQELGKVPTTFASVSLSAAGGEEDTANAKRVADTFLAETGWTPGETVLLAGAFAWTHYGLLKRIMMKRIARAKGQPTDDTSHDQELTDWAAVDSLAHGLAASPASGQSNGGKHLPVS